MAQIVKSLPPKQETPVQSLGQEDPLEKGVQTTLVFLPGESYGQRSLAGYSPWGCRELDMTERLTHNTRSMVGSASGYLHTGCISDILDLNSPKV